MNKEEFVDKYWAAIGGQKKDAVIAVDTFVDILSDVLKSGDYLYIGSLGKFETKDIPAKTMTYLKGDKTGQHYVKPAYKKITFRPSKALKDKLERD